MQSPILQSPILKTATSLLTIGGFALAVSCNSRSTTELESSAGSAAPAASAGAPAPPPAEPAATPSGKIALPSVIPVAGVKRVLFGAAQRRPGSGGMEYCTIPSPLTEPAVFPSNTTELTYVVELEARSVKSAATEVVAPEGQGQLIGRQCNGFTIIPGGFSQTQLGNTISRLDKQPLKAGTYTLRITTDGQSADVVFVVK